MTPSSSAMPSADGMALIVPVHNGARTLTRCIDALAASSGAGDELVVVDDGSDDDSAGLARALGARVLSLGRNQGAAAARNHGVAASRAPLVCFVDADVAVHPDALERLRRRLSTEPGLAAVFGSYDDSPSAQGLVSRYRNLLHHHTHQTGRRDAATFWTGLGAVRRSAFEAIGGFDTERFGRCGMEDVDLGDRLRRSGRRIALDPRAQGTHLKAWSLWSMIRTDVLNRAIPWARLTLERRSAPNDLNLRLGQRASVALTLACMPLVLAGLWYAPSWLLAVPVCILAVVALNLGLFGCLRRRYGTGFALAAVPLHLLFYAYSGLAYLYVLAGHLVAGASGGIRRAAAGAGRQ